MTDTSIFSKDKDRYLQPFREVLKKARIQGDTVKICEALSGLGMALFKVEEFEQGAENLDLSVSLANELGDMALAARYIGIKGMALSEANNPEPAAQCFQQVINMADDMDNPGLKCDALGNIGLVFVDTGDAGLAYPT